MEREESGKVRDEDQPFSGNNSGERYEVEDQWKEVKRRSEVFNRIGEKYGTLIKKSQASTKDGNLSFERVGVLVKTGARIEEEICIQWGGAGYRGG
ncbi:hypothetical protein R6Q59_033590 [Mikania micrantha]